VNEQQIFLADGREVWAKVTAEDGEHGIAVIDGRAITVWRFVAPWRGLGWGELVHGHSADGGEFDAIWLPEEYKCGVARAYAHDGAEPSIYVRDKQTGQWREMTGEEYEQERRAWDADQRDMEKIRGEWQAYRNEGLGERR
jgi:hypothetical protein